MDYTWQYYDVVLLGIGSSLLIGVAVGALTPVVFTTAVIGAGLAAAGIIGHALFVNGPVDSLGDLTEEVDPERLR